MKDSRRIRILGVFSVIWICKPIPYETVSYYINKREETVLKVLAVGRAGGQGADSNNFVGNVLGLKKRKKIDPTFHSRLVQQFPDWNERMDYQQKQEKFYESAIRKRREIQKLRIQEIPDFLTKEELDAIDYFQGTGFYLKYQDPKTNIFDTKKSFLLKMHDIVLRENFLNSFNRSNN
jgi:hypothetical protein